jgi:replication factor C subunit 3/5
VNCIPGDLIMKIMLEELLLAIPDDDLKPSIIQWVAYYENKMKKGSKPLFHIEAMIARVMVLYKKSIDFDF